MSPTGRPARTLYPTGPACEDVRGVRPWVCRSRSSSRPIHSLRTTRRESRRDGTPAGSRLPAVMRPLRWAGVVVMTGWWLCSLRTSAGRRRPPRSPSSGHPCRFSLIGDFGSATTETSTARPWAWFTVAERCTSSSPTPTVRAGGRRPPAFSLPGRPAVALGRLESAGHRPRRDAVGPRLQPERCPTIRPRDHGLHVAGGLGVPVRLRKSGLAQAAMR